ncbi:uncharacterized protein PV09_06462 [Verruconis gallopava]|uniref:Sulfatase N-terminal domain-containing protein n=1 Tax=Verruconis gallopava TaxID=253628 RepID=A0A0D1XJ43_9PEZI|nr:uncharacterized protein PV09_06462 [Verruconis gallopava]KIW02316.1 hypothetical protein PV09_06462 [Verruconis gallopava]
MLAHNTNVTDVNPPYGGYPKFISQGFNDDHLAQQLRQAAHTWIPAIWFLLDPYTYQYWNFSTTRNGAKPQNYLKKYSSDHTAETAYEFLKDALETQNIPFFVTIAPIAPHADVSFYPEMRAGPPEVAERHRHLFTIIFLERQTSIPNTPVVLNNTVLAYNDEYQRQRLRSLQAVDEMVENIVSQLSDAGALENTYIIYTSDNGYHISQHRMHPGKECGYETDIRVPMIIRGPGVPEGEVSYSVSSHTNIAPTIMTLAGNDLRFTFDGQPMHLHNLSASRPEHLNVEFWGLGVPEGKYGYGGKYGYVDGPGNAYVNNTYKSLRIENSKYGFYYSVWCTGEKELYDMKADPAQMNNLLGSASSSGHTLLGRAVVDVVDRLDALLMVLKSCKGESCVAPWKHIHPQGDVHSLTDALHRQFDSFYTQQPKVAFSKCELGYIKSSEGPQDVNVFESVDRWSKIQDQNPMLDVHWSLRA